MDKKKEKYIKMTQSIMQMDLTDGQKLLWGYMAGMSNNKRKCCYASLEHIAKFFNKSTKTIQRRIDKMVKKGFLRKEPRPYETNLYFVKLPSSHKTYDVPKREDIRGPEIVGHTVSSQTETYDVPPKHGHTVSSNIISAFQAESKGKERIGGEESCDVPLSDDWYKDDPELVEMFAELDS